MRIAVLGPLEVRDDDGAPVVVPGAKERLLLAVLASGAPGVLSTDRLVEALWNGDAPVSARKSLHAHLVRLRGALEPDRPRGSNGRYVVRRGAGYALTTDDASLDLRNFPDLAARARARAAAGDPAAAERLLVDALEMWRGEPFADWPDAEFAVAERPRLAAIRASTLAALVECRLALGRADEVVADLERLVSEEPLSEQWWRLLMLALYRSGRQADALAAGRRARTVLAEELGADPGPALRAMEAAVLAQDPALDLPPIASPPVVVEAEAGPGRCPYMGLAAYQVADAPFFRGRRRLVAALVARLVDARIVVVSGPSGAGKSSAVRAGLLPALAAGALGGSKGWQPLVVTPGRNPVDCLAVLTGESPPSAPVVLVCDQTEQLWTAAVDPAERTAFLDTVLGLVEDGIVARCVVVVRGDHVGRLAEHAPFAEALVGALVLVPPMTDPELREAVEEPAAAVGLTVEPELLDTVVADVLSNAGALPLLSMALVGTWERRRGDRLTLAGYLEAGGVAGALTRSAEEAYTALDATGRETARRLLLRLADVDDGGALVRRAAALAELGLDAEQAASRRAVVEAFVDRRLLSVDGDHLEVSHESLFTAWPRLARWLEDDAAGRVVRRHLAPAAREWDARDRPTDELYRGARLAAALDWASGPDGDPTPLEHEFLTASQERADAELHEARDQTIRERRARRRTRRLAVGLAAVLVVALVATVLALRFQRAADERAAEAQQTAREADADRLAALSSNPGSLDIQLLLAVQGVRLARTPESEDALLSGLLGASRALRVLRPSDRVRAAVLAGRGTLFLDDGVSLSTLSVEPAGQPTETARPVGTWGRWDVADGSPVADQLVAAGRDIYGRMWVRVLAADGAARSLVENGEVPGRPLAVSFSGDGTRVRLIATTGGAAAGGELAWRVTEFDLADGSRRDTGIAGRVSSSGDAVRAHVSDDGRTAVVFDGSAGAARATLVSLTDGREVDLRISRRSVPSTGFRATSTGAVQMWADGMITRYGSDGRRAQEEPAGESPILDAVVAPDGTWAASVGGAGRITLWDIDASTGRWTRRVSFVGHDGDVSEAEVTGDGAALVTRDAEGRLVVWDATPGGGFGVALGTAGGRALAGRPQVLEPGQLVVAPTVPVENPADGAAGPRPGAGVAATFLDLRTGRVVADVPLPALAGDGRSGRLMAAVSGDGAIVAVSDGRATTVLSARTRQPVGPPITLPPEAGADGRPRSGGTVSCLAWTPDSSRLLLCVDRRGITQPIGRLVAVDPSTGQMEDDEPLSDPFDAIATSPDGRWLAVSSATSGSLYLLDARTRILERVLSTDRPDAAIDIAYSPDGRWLVVVGDEGGLYVFDTEDSLPLTVPNTRDLLGAVWLRDSRTLAVTSSDGTVSLYDVQRRRFRTAAISVSGDDRPAPVYAVAAGDDLVAFSGQRPGRRWSLDPADWIERACAIAGRDLSRSEWDQYLPNRKYRPTCSHVD
jgi:DNA-binding SARP family transcriptional activator/WD40 repeat protein